MSEVDDQVIVVESETENDSIEIVEEVNNKSTVTEGNNKSTVVEIKEEKSVVAKDTNENDVDENLKNLESVVGEMLKDERKRSSILSTRLNLKKKRKVLKEQSGNPVNQALMSFASKYC